MFYAISYLDYALMAAATVFFLFGVRKLKKLYMVDYFAFAFMALLCLTMIRTGTGINQFIKMLSGFMLYFIGRAYYKEIRRVEKSLIMANYIVVATNLAMFVMGAGFVVWGSASTFRGMYYYKTDFSIAMIYAISAFAFLQNPPRSILCIEWAVIAYLILRSNTRAALLILILVFGLWFLYQYEKNNHKPLKINLKYAVLIVISLVAALFIVVRVLSLSVFDDYHFISFNFSTISDLLNTSNTQGRNVIWNNLLRNFREASWIQKLIGIDFVSDYWNGLDAHNAYLKILFSTGILGLLIFFGFVGTYIRRLNKLKDRSLFYFNLSILLTFMLQSISQSSIAYTQMTWVFLCFSGMAVTESYNKTGEEYHFNKEKKLNIRIRRRKESTKAISSSGNYMRV